MLVHLSIKNYALIQSLEIDPATKLNIITGETGAGKSIMLGAVGLLLGKRADTKALLNDSEKCIIEGTFNVSDYNLNQLFDEKELDYEEETIIRREITPSGKSRAFINDTPVTLDILRGITNRLIDVHSQHDQLLLGTGQFQLNLIDLFAGHGSLIENYQKAFLLFSNAKRHYEILLSEAAEINKEKDYNNFLLEELDKINLIVGEQSMLEEELKVLESAEEVKKKLFEASAILDNEAQSVNLQLEAINTLLNQLVRISPTYKSLQERLNSCLIELRDITDEINTAQDNITHDPEKTAAYQEKLSGIYNLQQKHQVTSLEELIVIKDELSEKVLRAANLDDEIDKAEKEKHSLEEKMMKHATVLSESRQKHFEPITDAIEKLLNSLGMPNAALQVSSKIAEAGGHGIDIVNLLFSANKGVAPQPLKNVASGGEFARLMFCIKYILADKTALPTIIFDEIDTGISGEIAIKMATMMQTMAKNHQVISISHLPQFAAKGDAHFFVYKDNNAAKTISKIKVLAKEERILEIAKMIGGDHPTDSAFENARELMGIG